jgi:hypothetical protein
MPARPWRQDEEEYLEGARRELRERCREELGGFVGDLAEWTLFMTLTFDPLVMAGTSEAALEAGRRQLAVPAVSRWTAMRRFRYFLEHASDVVGRPTVGVVALEPHQSGQPHGHGLLSIEGGVVGGEIVSLSRLWREYRGNGWIRLEEPRSQEDVTGYCAKYMAKDASELVFSSSLVCGPEARPRTTKPPSWSADHEGPPAGPRAIQSQSLSEPGGSPERSDPLTAW